MPSRRPACLVLLSDFDTVPAPLLPAPLGTAEHHQAPWGPSLQLPASPTPYPPRDHQLLDGLGAPDSELPPFASRTSGIQGLMRVTQPRGERWAGSGFAASHPLQQKQSWDPRPRLASSPGSGPCPLRACTPTVLQISWGRLVPVVGISGHVPLEYSSVFPSQQYPSSPRRKISVRGMKGPHLIQAFPCPLSPWNGSRGAATCPACVSRSSEWKGGGEAQAPVAEGDKCAPSAALSGCSLTNKGRAQTQSNEVACLPRCREQWQSPGTTQQPLSTSGPVSASPGSSLNLAGISHHLPSAGSPGSPHLHLVPSCVSPHAPGIC